SLSAIVDVRVYGPRVAAIQLRTKGDSAKAALAALGPEATPQNASACRSSARWVLRLACACRSDRSALFWADRRGAGGRHRVGSYATRADCSHRPGRWSWSVSTAKAPGKRTV